MGKWTYEVNNHSNEGNEHGKSRCESHHDGGSSRRRADTEETEDSSKGGKGGSDGVQDEDVGQVVDDTGVLGVKSRSREVSRWKRLDWPEVGREGGRQD